MSLPTLALFIFFLVLLAKPKKTGLIHGATPKVMPFWLAAVNRSDAGHTLILQFGCTVK